MPKEDPMIVLLVVLKDMFERSHRLIEQEKLDDFEMLEDLHSSWYWEAEREDVLYHLKQVLPEETAAQFMANWQKEFDDEHSEAQGASDAQD